MYNEIAGRQGHPTCTMTAFDGTLIPNIKAGKPPKSDKDVKNKNAKNKDVKNKDAKNKDGNNKDPNNKEADDKDADDKNATEAKEARKRLEPLKDFDLVVIAVCDL